MGARGGGGGLLRYRMDTHCQTATRKGSRGHQNSVNIDLRIYDRGSELQQIMFRVELGLYMSTCMPIRGIQRLSMHMQNVPSLILH